MTTARRSTSSCPCGCDRAACERLPVAWSLFLLDGALGGKRLGRGISRYIAYTDLDERRLALAMGMIGLIMAATNWLVVRLFSTDVWLFYTTFVDIFFSIGMVLAGVQWARHKNRSVS